MIEIKDEVKFSQIVSTAIENAITNAQTETQARRWENAINRAVTEIESNPFLTYDPETTKLLICSPSNKIYSSNGVCQCVAYLEFGQPCWHRAAARLVRLYHESLNEPDGGGSPAPAFATVAPLTELNMPYITVSREKAVCVGNIKI